MLKKIYLLLTGENEKKRSRSKKLLKEIEKEYGSSFTDEFKIIITGKSGFDFYLNPTEAENLKNFLIKKSPKLISNIIIENDYMDTLGNMIFSYPIICNTIKLQEDKNIEIVLITEKFHMKRSRALFLEIFKNLFFSYKELQFKSISANSLDFNSLFLKRALTKFFKNLLRFRFDDRNLMYLIKKEERFFNRSLIGITVQSALFVDLDIHYKNKLNNYEDYKDYLFSLPIYNEHYKSIKKMDLNLSAYKVIIEIHMKKRAKLIKE